MPPSRFMPNATLELARRIAGSSWDSVNEAIGDEAVRALVNWLGCALAGARASCLDDIPETDDANTNKAAEATVLGRGYRIDLLTAADIIASGTEALGYTDTHAPTGLCPSAVVAGALLPLAEHRAASGAAFVHAYILGVELACRVATALGAPAGPHTPEGALCNALGAASACARLVELDAERTALALDLACAAIEAADDDPVEQPRGTTSGFAARTGLLMALRAEAAAEPELHATPRSPLERLLAMSGVFRDDWMRHWHSTRLAYHAYPCALFLHPVVEACLQLERAHHLTEREISAVRVRMHPSGVAMNQGDEPASAQAAQCSVQHAAAVALLDGRAGLSQFDSAKLHDGRVKELRRRVEVGPDQALPETAVQITITQPDGGTVERFLRCALGHPLRPLGDQELSDKFRGLAGEMLASGQVERLLGLAWNVRALPDMGGLIRTTLPEEVYEPADLPGSPLIPR